MCSANKDAGTSGLLDSLLSELGEHLSLDNDWDLWHSAFTENLAESVLGNIDDGNGLGFALLSVFSDLFAYERPNLVTVDDWGPCPVILLVEYSNTALSEETRMIFVHHNSLVMHTTGKTTTTW